MEAKQQKPESLLRQFISKILAEYFKPIPTGSKGRPKGMSEEKYKACLSFLYCDNKTLKDRAKGLRVPYGVLRNWLSEKDFIEQVSAIRILFSLEILDYLERQVKTGTNKYTDYAEKTPIDELIKNPSPQTNNLFELFEDAHLYHPSIWQFLSKLMDDKSFKDQHEEMMFSIVLLMKHSMRFEIKQKTYFDPMLTALTIETLDSIIDQLKKPINDKNRRLIIQQLAVMKNNFQIDAKDYLQEREQKRRINEQAVHRTEKAGQSPDGKRIN